MLSWLVSSYDGLELKTHVYIYLLYILKIILLFCPEQSKNIKKRYSRITCKLQTLNEHI